MSDIEYAVVGGPPDWYDEVRVWVNGAEVTNTCFEANAAEGWVRCYLFKDGDLYLNSRHTGARWHKRRGKVEIRRRLNLESNSKVLV